MANTTEQKTDATEQKSIAPQQTKKDIALKQLGDLVDFYASFAGKHGYNPYFYIHKEINPVVSELNSLSTGDVPDALQAKVKALIGAKAESNALAPVTKAESFLYRKR